MPDSRATTVRFSPDVYGRLNEAASATGLTINAIAVVACLDWLDLHWPRAGSGEAATPQLVSLSPPRRSTISQLVRALGYKGSKGPADPGPVYPFDRFTEQAKHALALAQEEARASHHSYIGTEHLLLGLLGEPEGMAAAALSELGVEVGATRKEIESILGRSVLVSTAPIQPTSRVKKVIELAFGEAQRAGSHRVGTDHLLLGIVLEGNGIAAKVLLGHDVTPAAVMGQLEELAHEPGAMSEHHAPGGGVDEPELEATDPPIAALLEAARAEAAKRGDEIAPEHLLLALLRDRKSPAGRALREAGLGYTTMARRLRSFAPTPRRRGPRTKAR